MQKSSILIAALAFAGAPLHAQTPDELANKVLTFFKARCVACHGTNATEPKKFQFIDNLTELAKSDFVDLKVPENSRLYTVLRDSEMPILTKAEKQEGKKRVEDVAAEDVALVKAWIVAGAPSVGGAATPAPQKPVATTPVTPVAPPKTEPAAESTQPKRAPRRVVSHQEVIAAAIADLNSLPREEQSGTRYISIASLHNNSAEVSEGQLDIMRSGVRKMMNSLSTNPDIAKFEEVGPEKVLFRIRLRDVNWSDKLWDRVASFFPQAVDAGLSSALATATGAKVSILPAEWMAATATRPPLYHEILDLPQKLADLEKRLGVNATANILAGEVVRAGFTESGVSAHNRLIERHSVKAWSGYYWVSYDFKSSGGKSSLLANPLGPESANILGGAHAFKHAGGEFIFSLPNGMQAYYVADVLGNRLDGAVPTDIVGDKTNVTGRVEISNGLSCVICHENGMREGRQTDQVRAIAGGFENTEAKELIERLHPPQDKVDAILKQDSAKFLAALAAAGVKQSEGREPVGELAKRFEKPVTLAKAAAELGISEEDFAKRVDPRKDKAFFDIATLLADGTLAREHFLDLFPDIIARLGIGKVRKSQALAEVKLPGRDDVKKLRPIAVQITTDKTRYRGGDEKDKKGDLLYATVTAAEAGHLRLLYQNAKGEIITLFPNQFQKDDRVPGGVPVKVPSDTAGFDIEIVGPPFGQEHLIAIVTDRPFTDEAALKAELAKTQFAEADTRDIEVAVAKSARVIARDDRGRRVGRTGFSRITIESHE